MCAFTGLTAHAVRESCISDVGALAGFNDERIMCEGRDLQEACSGQRPREVEVSACASHHRSYFGSSSLYRLQNPFWGQLAGLLCRGPPWDHPKLDQI